MKVSSVHFQPHPNIVEERENGVPLILEERLGIERIEEPVSMGVPFPKGSVHDPSRLVLFDHQDGRWPLQVKVLGRWSDGSIQWALLDFKANVPPFAVLEYRVGIQKEVDDWIPSKNISIQELPGILQVDTGGAVFFLDTAVFKPFTRVDIQSVSLLEENGSKTIFIDDLGNTCEPTISNIVVEENGPIRMTLKISGFFKGRTSSFPNFIARLTFFTNSSLVEVKFTLQNPRPAEHRGGLWDLGDKGSMYFKDLTLHLALNTPRNPQKGWTTEPGGDGTQHAGSGIAIDQDSSGGPNWNSPNHVNRDGAVLLQFPGYRISADGNVIQEGKRATPTIWMQGDGKYLAGAIQEFWQNFPKALEVNGGELCLRLFPLQSDLYELQGGEQKTHCLFVQFGTDAVDPPGLEWVHDRLLSRSTPEWYVNTQAIHYLTSRNQDPNQEFLALIDHAILGPHSFFDRREIIDEYGWRHFGEVYADHEAVGNERGKPRISHYNNQYDVIYGGLIEYLRSGDVRWYSLAHDLARHVIDIDIYHTDQDRRAYNGGLFWHTDHYMDAGMATHRTFSKTNLGEGTQSSYGGGPSNEHNYTTGLLLYFLLTGDSLAYEAVKGLADWVIHMDSPSKGILGLIDKRPTGLASATVSREYHGPGRGAGNSINALLDASLLTGEPKYWEKAEELIRRCIHPKESIEEKGLSDIEHRWSYTIFLQVLGKYLDRKVEKNEIDYMYGYAKASLLHYADWMLIHEVPYKQMLHCVEIPTETWPAQDIRKSNVFKFAAKYAENPVRCAYLEKSEYFFHACLEDLRSFKTCTLVRPIVLLLVNGYMHTYFHTHPNESGPAHHPDFDFGMPQSFTPQLFELYQAKRWCESAVIGFKNFTVGLLAIGRVPKS